MDYQFQQILKSIALENNMTPEEVYQEMEVAIAVAYDNEDPEAKLIWADIPCNGDRPTPEEVIMALAKKTMQDL